MTSTTVNENTKPMVNIVKLRERIKQLAPEMRAADAEAIAVAIDESLQQQDTTGFATKGDIKILEARLEAKIDNVMDKMTVRFGLMIIGTLGVIKTTQMMGWW